MCLALSAEGQGGLPACWHDHLRPDQVHWKHPKHHHAGDDLPQSPPAWRSGFEVPQSFRCLASRFLYAGAGANSWTILMPIAAVGATREICYWEAGASALQSSNPRSQTPQVPEHGKSTKRRATSVDERAYKIRASCLASRYLAKKRSGETEVRSPTLLTHGKSTVRRAKAEATVQQRYEALRERKAD